VAKFKNLITEQSRRTDPYSPVFDTVKHMEPEEENFLEDHESNPSATNVETPPAQIEWQWDPEDVDFVYNCHLFKEIYDNSIYGADVEDPDTPKRYTLLGFVYNKNNNLTGIVPDYTDVSEEFSEPANLEVLANFLERQDFLYENDTEERKIYTFSRPADFDY
jgi:hypothetical protein